MTRAHWVLFLAIVFGAFAACTHESNENPTQVPATYEEVRTAPGHVAHLGKTFEGKTIACNDCHALDDGGLRSPGVAPCAKCHKKADATHHVGNATTQTTCLTCHVFGKGTVQTCASCHAAPKG
ncbi:MAG: hypothetical protein ACXWP4_19825, partial [Polyangiales bacterium]